MHKPSTTVLVLVGVLALVGAACGGGGGDDDNTADQASGTTAPVDDVTTTTEDVDEASTTTGAPRTDIDPCGLLTAAELEGFVTTVPSATSFKVKRQDAKPPDARGVFQCTHYFTVIEEKGGGARTEVDAGVLVEVHTRNAASQYRNLSEFGEKERIALSGLGDKAFYDVERGSVAILDDDLVVIVDSSLPGYLPDGSDRPLAEAIAPVVLGRL